jgi:hypothetical protein
MDLVNIAEIIPLRLARLGILSDSRDQVSQRDHQLLGLQEVDLMYLFHSFLDLMVVIQLRIICTQPIMSPTPQLAQHPHR